TISAVATKAANKTPDASSSPSGTTMARSRRRQATTPSTPANAKQTPATPNSAGRKSRAMMGAAAREIAWRTPEAAVRRPTLRTTLMSELVDRRRFHPLERPLLDGPLTRSLERDHRREHQGEDTTVARDAPSQALPHGVAAGLAHAAWLA